MLPCHTGGAGEKVAGVLRWTKKVSSCVIGKNEIRKRGRKKRKSTYSEKRQFVREKKKGVKKRSKEKIVCIRRKGS